MLKINIINYLYKKAEEYLFFPTFFQKIVSILLLPLTAIYCFIGYIKRIISIKEDFGIDIISVGNLILGGSGKTPFIIELCRHTSNHAIILRGYKRKSRGTLLISLDGEILENLSNSGDEAMLFATSVQKSTVIVSNNRKEGIKMAINLGKTLVFLDDGFNKFNIKKIDILLKSKKEPTNIFCLPSGGYKENILLYDKADFVLKEGIEFKRESKLPEINKDSILITAISKPKRLLEYIPKIEYVFFPDHYEFLHSEISNILKQYKKKNIITTSKDYVKLQSFDFDIRVIDMKIVIDDDIINSIKQSLHYQ